MGNMCDNFIIYEDNKNEFQIWQGLVGAHFTPHVDELGNLSWTNNGGLSNPAVVNIQGRGLTIVGIVEDVSDLPETADNYVTYLVGEDYPYNGYIYDNGNWVNLGLVGASAGFGTPTATVDGNVGTPAVTITASGPDTAKVFAFAFSNLKGEPGQGSPATATPLMDGTAAVGSSDKYAREDHVHPLYNQFVRPNLLDNWYFVGGGSQQGGGQFPINQRGQTIYSNGYGIDRWTGASLDVTINSNSVTVTNNGGSQQWYKQIFTNLPNGEFTGSVLVTSVSGGVEFVMQEEGGNWQTPFIGVISSVGLISRTGAKTVDSTYNFGFALPAGASVTFQALKLELGTTQTLAHQENGTWVLNEIPDYEEQLLRCNTSVADSGDTYANKVVAYTNEVGGALYFQNVAVSATTGDIVVLYNSKITDDHVLAECVFANPSAIITNVTWSTWSDNHVLVLNGTCTAATTADIVLVKKNN